MTNQTALKYNTCTCAHNREAITVVELFLRFHYLDVVVFKYLKAIIKLKVYFRKKCNHILLVDASL